MHDVEGPRSSSTSWRVGSVVGPVVDDDARAALHRAVVLDV